MKAMRLDWTYQSLRRTWRTLEDLVALILVNKFRLGFMYSICWRSSWAHGL